MKRHSKHKLLGQVRFAMTLCCCRLRISLDSYIECAASMPALAVDVQKLLLTARDHSKPSNHRWYRMVMTHEQEEGR